MNVQNASAITPAKRQARLRTPVLVTGLVVVLAVWFFRDSLRNEIARKAILANPAPPPDLVEEMIEKSSDQTAAILAAWNSGKIVHRQVAARQISRVVIPGQSLPSELQRILFSAALDVDMTVRETAFGILNYLNHPAMPALSAAQLADPDPQVRLLGLNHAKRTEARIGVPMIIPLLEEEDPLIVTMGLKLLEKWSGKKFGVKLSDVAPSEDETTGLNEFRQRSRQKAKDGAARAKEWWAAQRSNFPPVKLSVPKETYAARQDIPAGDFSLPDLDGRRVRLSDYRGKVVLINFWTTWCTACIREMPELIALQKKSGGRLAILGVSLDFVPDSHGHIGGHAAVEEQNQGHHDDHERDADALKRVREKVRRTAKDRGINYTVLLDERNEIGGRFNGGELPTTVIIDAKGNIRRRFVGARSLSVFEAMIANAEGPLSF